MAKTTVRDGNDRRMRRVEGWFTPHQILWLRTIRVTEKMPVSRILRDAVNLYLHEHIEVLRKRMAMSQQPSPARRTSPKTRDRPGGC